MPPLDFQFLVGFWPLLKIFLKEHLNIGKIAKKQPHIFKNKKIMTIWKFLKIVFYPQFLKSA